MKQFQDTYEKALVLQVNKILLLSLKRKRGKEKKRERRKRRRRKEEGENRKVALVLNAERFTPITAL